MGMSPTLWKVGWPDKAPKTKDERKQFVASLHKRKTDLFMALIEKKLLPLQLGVTKLVDQALGKGVKVVVCSTSNEKAVSAIVSILLGPERAEKIQIFCWCVVVEDSAIGLAAAKADGMKCIVTKSTSNLPPNSRKIGFSYSSDKLVKIKDYVNVANDDTSLVFMVGAMAHGKIEKQEADDYISSKLCDKFKSASELAICLATIDTQITVGNAAAALMARLAPQAKALTDGTWKEEDATMLVPGDIISINLGDIVPADARLLHGDPLKIDQSALTGESLPVTKNPGDAVYSGSTCKQGEIEAIVIATGVNTFFGKAAHLVENTTHVGHFQKVLTAIGNFCICSIAVGMVIEINVIYGLDRLPTITNGSNESSGLKQLAPRQHI